MSAMRIDLQPAFVLHRRPYRNTSLLVEILSRDHGRIALVARGVRTLRSRLKGLLQPFIPLLLSWSGRGELSNLITAEEAARLAPLPPERILSGLYANELMLHLLQRSDPHPGLFEAYQQLLQALPEQANQEPALRIFEKHLLAGIGYGLLLDTEAMTGEPIVAQGSYRYILERGPVCAEATKLGISISGNSLLALQNEQFQDLAALREAKRLTRTALNKYLQGRPLKTRELASKLVF